jgi:hypothetical protein
MPEKEQTNFMLTHADPARATQMALLVSLTGLLSTGCAWLSPPTGVVDSGATAAAGQPAEAIFRYQSRIASRALDRFADLAIEGVSDGDPTLVAAEARMAETCRHLNEAAVSRVEGHPPSWDLKLRVFATSGICAAAAREVELLLENDGDSIATARL